MAMLKYIGFENEQDAKWKQYANVVKPLCKLKYLDNNCSPITKIY
jgi:hypothetical protein